MPLDIWNSPRIVESKIFLLQPNSANIINASTKIKILQFLDMEVMLDPSQYISIDFEQESSTFKYVLYF